LALAALLVLVLAPAAHAKRSVPEQFMGMNWDFDIAEAPEAVQAQQFPRMAAAGVETLRPAFYWGLAQPQEDGPIDLSRSDSLMRMASAHGIRVLPTVIVAPEWARLNKAPLSPPRSPGLIGPYTQALIARYGPTGTFWSDNPDLPRLPIRDWQYWNEPHLPYQWTLTHNEDWRKTYTANLRAFHGFVEQGDPGAKVVLGGLTNESWKYMRQLYAAGAGRFFDVATVHPYTQKPGGVLRIVERFRAVMKKHGQARKPVWITEVGLPASRGRSKSDNRLQTTDKGMAKWLTASYKDVAAHLRSPKLRVTRMYWYTWASEYRGDIFRYTGLLRFRAGGEPVRKPAYAAYVKVARKLTGCRRTRTGRCEE
jgi:hypothetical protein